LLLRYSSEYEFVHRRLRDYFALRRVLPLLQSENMEQRMQAIDMLAFQGDAAVEILIDLVRESPSAIAVASAKALGRSASPEALIGIREAATHQDPSVRAAMLGRLDNVGKDEASSLIGNAVADTDASVVVAALKMHQDLHLSGSERRVLLQKAFDASPGRDTLLRALVRTNVELDVESLPDSVFPECVSALESDDHDLAPTYLRLLAARRYKVPASRLAPFTEPRFPMGTRTAALDALVACAPKATAPYLLAALQSGERILEDKAIKSWDRLKAYVNASERLPAEWAEVAEVATRVEILRQRPRTGTMGRLPHRLRMIWKSKGTK
jgi:HEAT repeat protein